MNALIEKFNQVVSHADFAKLLLRLGFGGMFLLHGIAKMLHGVDGIIVRLTNAGLPEFVAYGSYLGELVAPILIVIGLFTRASAFVCVMTSLFIVYLVHIVDQGNLFALSKVGGWAVELIGTFLFGFLAIMFLGSGKYAVKAD